MNLKKLLLLFAILIVLSTVFVVPYSYSDGFRFYFGYPISFFTMYNLPPIQSNEILLMRTQINVFALILDVYLVYSLLNIFSFLISKMKNGRNYGKEI
ncbi:hypothetical protein KHQ82_10530 [Mycoplasmatota bacterium]|nr:hypothetical protein KHQ82_10530 [Mycoplasmatota bacterium]